MTHHKNRNPVPGPRRLQRRAETGRRMDAIRRAADKGIVTLPAIIVQVRAQTELNARDRAERMKGGPGGTRSTYEQARARYGTKLTPRQQRALMRHSTEEYGTGRPQHSGRYTWGKGAATAKRGRYDRDPETGGRKLAAFLSGVRIRIGGAS